MDKEEKKRITWVDRFQRIIFSYFYSRHVKRIILYSFYALFAIVISIFVYYFIQNRQKVIISEMYYKVINDFFEKFESLEKKKPLRPTDDEIINIISKYVKIVSYDDSEIESSLSYLNLGTIYYFIKNYRKAAISFEKSLNKIPFKYQVLINVGHSFFSLGDERNGRKYGNFVLIEKDYQTALKFYEKVEKEYGYLHNILGLNRYIGLVNESLGDLYIKFNKGNGIALNYYKKAEENYKKIKTVDRDSKLVFLKVKIGKLMKAK